MLILAHLSETVVFNFIIAEKNYLSNDEVLNAVKDEEVAIALLDAFTVAALAEELVSKSLKVTKLIDANTGYGIVLSHEFVRMESDFRSYISSQSNKISAFRTNMTDKLYVRSTAIFCSLSLDI